MNTIKLVSAVLLIGVQIITPTIGQFSQAAGQAFAGNSQSYPIGYGQPQYGYNGQPLYGQSQGAQASATADTSTVQNTQPGYYGPNQFTQSYIQPGYSGLSIYPQPYNNGPCQSECMFGNIIYQIALLAQECQGPSYLQALGYQQGFQQGFNSVGFAPAQNQQFSQPIGYQEGATYASTQTLQNVQPTNNGYQPQSYYPQPQYLPQQPYQQTPYNSPNSPQTYYESGSDSYGLSYGNANSGGSSGSVAFSDSGTYADTTYSDGSEVTQQDSGFSFATADANSDPSNPAASALSLTGASSYTAIQQPPNN